MDDPRAPTPTSWLDRLQQESWQLELLISGFVVFLLIGGWEPTVELNRKAMLLIDQSRAYIALIIMSSMLITAYLAVLVALIVHVALRGLWIAAIGLRSVSGEIDYRSLGYRARYRAWLSRRMGSFDAYIERLERYCSVLFSIAFLVLFCFLSLTAYFMVAMLMQYIALSLMGDNWRGTGVFGNNNNIVVGILNLIYLGCGLIYLIDFVSLGFFKRNRFTARWYFPLYRFMGWVTLAGLYRPLYHNLVDDRFGRRLARLLPLFVLGALLALSVNLVTHGYFPYYARDGEVWIDHQNYDDEEPDLTGQNWRTTLSSRYANHDYVEAFVPYRPRLLDPVIEHEYPDLEFSRFTGVKFGQPMQFNELYNRAANYDSLLIAFTSAFQLYVDDSLRNDIPPRFYYHQQRKQPGLLYMVPTHDLGRGEHGLSVYQRRIYQDSLYWEEGAVIHFYK